MRGGSVIDYELKYLFILLTSVLRQKAIQIASKQIDWQKIFRYAEYHDVTSLLYHAVLGMENTFTETQKQELYQKYKKELLLEVEYRSAEEAIVWQLEQHHIHAVLLSGTADYELYDFKGTGYIGNLEFLAAPEDLRKISELMYTMDYEPKTEHGRQGLFFVRPPGIEVRFLEEIPYAGRIFQRVFERQLKSRTHVQLLPADEQYMYKVSSAMEHYLFGDITIRQILNFYLYKEKSEDLLSKDTIKEIFKKVHMTNFERCLMMLSNLWFGFGTSPEEISLALDLEAYVLNPGKGDAKLDSQLLPLSRESLDFYDRNREEEWRSKKKGWLFPPRDYMQQIFPVLEKMPVLIIFCWCIRGFRILKKIVFSNIENLKTAVLEKLKNIRRCKGEHEDEKHENK